MAAWTEYQRASVRRWLGYGALYLQADPRLETAMTTVLAVSDGGTRPDSSTQQMIIGWLTLLDGQPGAGSAPAAASIEGQWLATLPVMFVGSADNGSAKTDAIRGLFGLFKVGRLYVRNICFALGFTAPLHDIFSSSGPANESHIRQPANW